MGGAPPSPPRPLGEQHDHRNRIHAHADSPYPGLNITETVERHDVDGAQLRDALDRINHALTKAWDIAHCGLTQEQFTQLVCHCFYNTLLDDALVHTLHAATISRARSITCLVFRIDELITTDLSA